MITILQVFNVNGLKLENEAVLSLYGTKTHGRCAGWETPNWGSCREAGFNAAGDGDIVMQDESSSGAGGPTNQDVVARSEAARSYPDSGPSSFVSIFERSHINPRKVHLTLEKNFQTGGSSSSNGGQPPSSRPGGPQRPGGRGPNSSPLQTLHKLDEEEQYGRRRMKAEADAMTGLVVDVGEHYTHVVPITDGVPIITNSRRFPLGGRHVTQFIDQALFDRKEPIPKDIRMDVARSIKEKHAYFCRMDSLPAEMGRYDPALHDSAGPASPASLKIKTVAGEVAVSRKKVSWRCEIGSERFLGPEIFFHPEILGTSTRDVPLSLAACIDDVIVSAPIDYRRALYRNVVLCGGSAGIVHFPNRLQKELQRHADGRLEKEQVWNV